MLIVIKILIKFYLGFDIRDNPNRSVYMICVNASVVIAHYSKQVSNHCGIYYKSKDSIDLEHTALYHCNAYILPPGKVTIVKSFYNEISKF